MDKLLTVKEAADRLGRSEQSLRWLLHINKAPKSGVVGGRRMFRESDIDAYIKAAFADEVVA